MGGSACQGRGGFSKPVGVRLYDTKNPPTFHTLTPKDPESFKKMAKENPDISEFFGQKRAGEGEKQQPQPDG
jgi:hypothetical protein